MGLNAAETAGETLFTADEAARISGGSFCGYTNLHLFSVAIDSRKVESGALFVALKGEQTDGHRYLLSAVESGAAAVLVAESELDRPDVVSQSEALIHKGAGVIAVQDPLAALHLLAAAHLDRFPDLIRIGVTGSSGKTTTKEILGSMLAQKYQVRMTEGNFNSEFGLPLMALSVRRGDEVVLLEMGIDHPGEMDSLAAILRPDYALITFIGTAHIGRFGSRETIAYEKGRIFSLFDDKCVGFCSEGDEAAQRQKEKYPGAIRLYGPDASNTFGVKNAGLKGWLVSGTDAEAVLFPLAGQYNLSNFFGAAAVAAELGLKVDKILAGAAAVEPLFGRGRISERATESGAVTLVEDCYNANLESVSSALDFLSDVEHPGRKVLVLGSMKELGELSEESHRSVGRMISGTGLDLVFFFGEETRWSYEELISSDFDGEAFYIEKMDVLRDEAAMKIADGDLWMLKGSRSMALERLETLFAPVK